MTSRTATINPPPHPRSARERLRLQLAPAILLAMAWCVGSSLLAPLAPSSAQPSDPPISPVGPDDPDNDNDNGADADEAEPATDLEEPRIVPSNADWWVTDNPRNNWRSPRSSVERQNRAARRSQRWEPASTVFTRRNGTFLPDDMLGFESEAQWIWHEESPQEAWFRLEVPDTPGEVSRVDLWIACDDDATIWVNGHEAGRWGTHGDWASAAGGIEGCVALTDLIPFWREGEDVVNVIAIAGVDTSGVGGACGLVCELRINAEAVAPTPQRVRPFDDVRVADRVARDACLSLLDSDDTAEHHSQSEVLLTDFGELTLPAFDCDEVNEARLAADLDGQGRLLAVRERILRERLPDGAWEMDQVRRFFREEEHSDRRRRMQVIKRLAVFTAQELESVIPIWLDTTDSTLQADVAYHVGIMGLTGGAIRLANLLYHMATVGETDTTLALGCLTALWHLAPDLTSGAVADDELDEITTHVESVRESYDEDELVIDFLERVLTRLGG